MVGMVKMARMVKIRRNNSMFVVESIETLGEFVEESANQIRRILFGGFHDDFGETVDKTENSEFLGIELVVSY